MKSKFLQLVITVFVVSISVFAQSTPKTFENPILSGYHPDPSICRVGDDYYLVNSSFVWYPGLPVYHSKDLVNWNQIGNAVDRPDMVDFSSLPDKLGLFAPTIRYNEGIFYIINTCVGCKMNFYITATNPAGPWSDPVWLREAPGIDPDIFFDEDGKSYYTGMSSPEVREYDGQCFIYQQEIDLEKGKLIGERTILTYGHANNANYPEGPHTYKINGKYLLLISEGGTGDWHSLTVHHSDKVNGPYTADHINPVLTHRHLGREYPITAIGHGDLIQTQNDEWWCVMLGKRKMDGYTILARETFLARVEFEGRTPIFNPGKGIVLKEQKRPNLPWTPMEKQAAKSDFNSDELGFKWVTIRTPKQEFYSLVKGQLKLNLQPEVMDSLVHSSMLIQRIEHYNFEASTKMTFKTGMSNEQAGLTIYRTNENHFKLLKDKNSLVLIKSLKGESTEVARVPYSNKEVYLKAVGNDLEVQFYFGESEDNYQAIGKIQSLVVIADGQGNAQFNGPGVGVCGTSNGESTKNSALFDWFIYTGK